MSWHIEDWASDAALYDGKRFDSFEEARDFISQVADSEAYDKYPNDDKKREEIYDGICEDLYAIEDKEEKI